MRILAKKKGSSDLPKPTSGKGGQIKMVLRALAIALVYTVLAPSQARAEYHNFYVCNYLESKELRVAVVASFDRFWVQYWHSGAWYGVKPGGCNKLFAAEEVEEVYLSIRLLGSHASGPDRGLPLLHIPDGPETFFCIKKDRQPFKIEKKSKGELQSCSSAWGELQLYNGYVDFKDSQLIKFIVNESAVSISRSRSERVR